jgi:hypothetical protein
VLVNATFQVVRGACVLWQTKWPQPGRCL